MKLPDNAFPERLCPPFCLQPLPQNSHLCRSPISPSHTRHLPGRFRLCRAGLFWLFLLLLLFLCLFAWCWFTCFLGEKAISLKFYRGWDRSHCQVLTGLALLPLGSTARKGPQFSSRIWFPAQPWVNLAGSPRFHCRRAEVSGLRSMVQGAATGFASRSAGLCLIRESRPGFSFLPSFLPWPRAEDGSVDIQVSYKGLDLAG